MGGGGLPINMSVMRYRKVGSGNISSNSEKEIVTTTVF